ncbi:MFS transporter [Lihuaxuella thermophila]|uniref:MFS transporter, NNP family, nitrate/nitrite transporter n=1 Tax=Lihuaxuella thermophila TaxID=1173111 RepID=A0A1H8IML5_9BACL|nr:nitrate/nitrite transporter [Lihuaxuella thermophila]SEN69561.1 MFS transporter, NNP family, nitrate/nitrite transporter [Lihuaxuella thermophila]
MKGQTSALVLSTVSMIVCFAAWSVFPPIAGKIQEFYQLSTTEKSILIAAPTLLGSVMRIPLGILTDRYGGRKVYVLTMLFLILPLLAAGFVNSYGPMLLCAFLIGMAGTTFAISITYVSGWYPPQKKGFILGIAGMGNLGIAVANLTIPVMLNEFGISWVFWTLAIVTAMMALIFWMGTKDLPVSDQSEGLKESLSVVNRKETWLLSLFYFLTFGGFVSFSMYLPTFLKELFHLTAVDAGLKTAVFVMIATFIRPLGGYLSDRVGAEKVLTVVFSGIFICTLFITYSTNHFVVFSVSCLILSILLGTGNGAVFKLVPEVSPKHTGAVTGIVSAAGGIGGFFPPVVLGMIKDLTGDYLLGFLLLVGFSVVCLWMNRSQLSRRETRFGMR